MVRQLQIVFYPCSNRAIVTRSSDHQQGMILEIVLLGVHGAVSEQGLLSERNSEYRAQSREGHMVGICVETQGVAFRQQPHVPDRGQCRPRKMKHDVLHLSYVEAPHGKHSRSHTRG